MAGYRRAAQGQEVGIHEQSTASRDDAAGGGSGARGGRGAGGGVVMRATRLMRGPSMLAMVDQAAVSGASFLTTVLVGRFADAEQLGLYALGTSIVLALLAVQMSLLTTPYAVHHHAAGVDARAYAGSTVVMQLVMVAVVLVGLLAACAWFGGATRGLLWAMTFAVPVLLLREFYRRMAYARLSVARAVAIDVPVAVVQVTALAVIGAAGMLSAGRAFVALGAAAAIGAIIGFAGMRRDITIQRERLRADGRRNWSFGRWIAGAQLLEVINTQGTFWLVALVLGTAATGVYAACLAIVLLCNPFMLAVGNVLTPRAAEMLARDGAAALRRLVFRAAGALGIVMAVFCAALAVAGDPLVRTLYGAEFGGHGVLISVLGLTFLVGAVNMALNDGIRALGRSDLEFVATGLDSVATIGLGIIGLMLFGLVGLAWANLIGSVAALAMQGAAFQRLSRAAGMNGVGDQGNAGGARGSDVAGGAEVRAAS